MPHVFFDVTLEQPLVISQQAASAGAHQSLDYIPGSVLLGLVASRLYAQLEPQSAWILFHSGQVRFSDALPLSGKMIYQPLPLCWHSYKGESCRSNGYLLANQLFDPSQTSTDAARQPVQLRTGYVAADGRYLMPERQQTLKTAIDRTTGMAAESQLFGYEALSAGQTFRFSLQADDNLDPTLWRTLLQSLPGQARLGRSRSAQFGRVQISAQAEAALQTPLNAGTQLTLWLQSDLLLEDVGQACLTPHPHLLGLPEGSQWLVGQSFLRSRSYSAYNAFRRHFGPERQLISRGSVLRYSLPRALSNNELQQLQKGLGLDIECGLGVAAVNPSLLSQATPAFPRPAAAQAVTQKSVEAPASALITALRKRSERRLGSVNPERIARSIYLDLCQRISEARRFAGTPKGVSLEGAPGRSQWGRFKQMASDHRQNTADLWQALADEKDGVLRQRSGWGLAYGPQPDQQLGIWLKTTLQIHITNDNFAGLIGQLAVFGLQPSWLECCDGVAQQEQSA
jgi:CRISPR-associated protein Csx10